MSSAHVLRFGSPSQYGILYCALHRLPSYGKRAAWGSLFDFWRVGGSGLGLQSAHGALGLGCEEVDSV